MVQMLSAFFDVNENKFENYYWLDPLSKALYDDSTIKYKDKNTSLILSSYCGYTSAEEKLVSILFVSWVTEDYHKTRCWQMDKNRKLMITLSKFIYQKNIDQMTT